MIGPRPIWTVEESRRADAAAAAAGTPLAVLMRRAGEAVAAAVQARWTPRPVVVLCGPGDNGGDGYVAARRLKAAGWPVTVAAAEPGARRSEAAAQAAADWREGGGEVARLAPVGVEGAELVIDALFGAGLSRPPPSPAVDALARAEARGAPIVAVDLPSGLSGDTGRVLEHAPGCALTVTFGALKPAHVLQPGRALCGEVVVADIGLPAPDPGARPLHANGPELWLPRFPWPGVEAHKMQRGRLVVISGGEAHTGAARLCARGGLRIGAGLVTVLTPQDALMVHAAALEAVMVRAFDTEAELLELAENADAAVIGPGAGVGEATADNLLALAQTGAALVVDADALTAFQADPKELFQALDRDDVLTPHPGEFERVFPGLLKRSPERIAAAREAARRAGCVVVLKGADTVIACPDGRAAVNLNGSPWLATAGSGDVLAGFTAGLLAQGMESFEAACAAVWIHGEAAQGFGPGLIAEDLPDLAPRVLKGLWSAARG